MREWLCEKRGMLFFEERRGNSDNVLFVITNRFRFIIPLRIYTYKTDYMSKKQT
jgi:hypothetical protein